MPISVSKCSMWIECSSKAHGCAVLTGLRQYYMYTCVVKTVNFLNDLEMSRLPEPFLGQPRILETISGYIGIIPGYLRLSQDNWDSPRILRIIPGYRLKDR